MPTLDQHKSQQRIRLAIVAPSGSGKTGALAALANNGFKLWIEDFDNGLDILKSYTRPEFYKNIEYVPLQDRVGPSVISKKDDSGKAYYATPQRQPIGQAQAAITGFRLLDNWNGQGDLLKWTSQDIVVIDSNTTFGESLMLYVQSLNPNATRYECYGPAMEMQEAFYAKLLDDRIQCNLIITFHYAPLEDASGTIRIFPNALGKKLPPRVGQYFNNIVSIKSLGRQRAIRTVTDGLLDLKTSAPNRIPDEISMELDKDGYATGGLAKLFNLLRNPTNA